MCYRSLNVMNSKVKELEKCQKHFWGISPGNSDCYASGQQGHFARNSGTLSLSLQRYSTISGLRKWFTRPHRANQIDSLDHRLMWPWLKSRTKCIMPYYTMGELSLPIPGFVEQPCGSGPQVWWNVSYVHYALFIILCIDYPSWTPCTVKDAQRLRQKRQFTGGSGWGTMGFMSGIASAYTAAGRRKSMGDCIFNPLRPVPVESYALIWIHQ